MRGVVCIHRGASVSETSELYFCAVFCLSLSHIVASNSIFTRPQKTHYKSNNKALNLKTLTLVSKS